MSWMTRIRRVPSAAMLGASTAIVVLGFGASMAFASGGGSDSGHHKGLTCTPSHPHLGGGCQITFHDGNESKGYGGKAANANQQVCFTVNNPGDHVYGQAGNCSLTDKKGNAYGLFQAGVCGSATITATEAPEPGEPHGSATKTVVVVGGS